MRYSTEPRFRKYVKGCGFSSFVRKFGDKYGKKLMDTATKTGIDAAKTASKRVVSKCAEATGNLNGNKIADKITLIGKPKEKEKTKEIEEIYMSPEKNQQNFKKLQIFSTQHLMIKIYQDSLLKNGLKFMISETNYSPNKEIRIKTSMLTSDLYDFSDAYIVVEGDITLEGDNNSNKRNKNLAFKNNAPFINCMSKLMS